MLPPEGWCRLPPLLEWAEAVAPLALRLGAGDPARHGGTWRAGVNLLPNDATGAVGGGPPMPPEFAPYDRGQISTCLQGYPGRDEGESAAAHAFRRDRDAAHLDGLLPEGPARRRHLRERHRMLLGVALTDHAPGAAPFVMWERSHETLRTVLRDNLPADPARWGDTDLTEAYGAARRHILATHVRREIPLRRGEAVLVHRLALHGTAPWRGPDGRPRTIAWFRPDHPDPRQWLHGP